LPGLDDAEQKCWQQFTETATHLYAALNRELLDAHGLTLLDAMLLRLLANSRKGSARMGELAQELAVSPSRVSEQARRLESQGFVCRNRSPDDRRVVIASITRVGRAKLRPVLRTYGTGVRALYLNPLSRQQMTALGDSCRRIIEALP
jgi:DNA-binding MarR family transcriptional regulator